ncbi:S8 family serine peptidase [Sphingobium sufflavum]|uniref:S8 family serine peptidase n=1 Tax=Sphingobium sufflavum TaxID=1129547 RepID=UPI001F224B2F|nr:S8 family serine peptidase [Sphingobium sufflavum]MCE7796197.1 S8 family serine peptidase [Sphingobium sufflavum]
MMTRRLIPALLLCTAPALVADGPAVAQIGVPDVGEAVGGTVGSTLDRTGDTLGRIAPVESVTAPVRSVAGMARDRIERLRDFLRLNRASVEADEQGEPARRGVVLMLDGDAAALDKVRTLGFLTQGAEDFGNLGLSATQLTVPQGLALPAALARLRAALPDRTFTADQLLFPSGEGAGAAPLATAAGKGAIRTPVGLIDGGVGSAVAVRAARGFATGAPNASDHGTAIASLLRYAGVQAIVSADVFGRDPAGGSALAIVRALDWMQGQSVPVVSISLTGPSNPLLARAVGLCAARGMVIVAAVGNDGPAAPPAYPASYPAVLAVTGVDGRNRALIEAGRAAHLDYAAPAADMAAMDARRRWHRVRGTSFAVPLVAARVAAMKDAGRDGAALRAALDAQARDLGPKGPDALYGRGLLCGDCRPRAEKFPPDG